MVNKIDMKIFLHSFCTFCAFLNPFKKKQKTKNIQPVSEARNKTYLSGVFLTTFSPKTFLGAAFIQT